jgi:hypothetical protein
MRRAYYQVVGRGPWNIDHPNGVATAYRPGQTFEESPLNRSVVRGLRTRRLRKLDAREARHLTALAESKRLGPVTPKPGLPKPAPTPPKPPAPVRGSSESGSSE